MRIDLRATDRIGRLAEACQPLVAMRGGTKPRHWPTAFLSAVGHRPMETCPSAIPIMRASITPSLTPLWRSKAFPKTADLPQGSASSEPPATDVVPDLHCVASPPCHDVATQSLLTLPNKRASTQRQAEHEERRLDAVSWLSQVANGTQGAHLLHAQ